MCTTPFWEYCRLVWLAVRWYVKSAFCRDCDAEFCQVRVFKHNWRSPISLVCVKKHSGAFVALASSSSITWGT